MKNLIVAIAICFVLASSVSADSNRKLGASNLNHQSSSHHNSNNERHGGYKQKYYYNNERGGHYGRPHVSYVRPHRYANNHRYYDNYGALIITSGIVGYILGANH